MGDKSFNHLLEKCLQEIEGSGEIEAVLQRHPEHAEQLRPLLQLASSLKEEYAEVPEPQARLAGGRARLLREARDGRRAAAAEQVAARREALGQERRSSMRLRLVPTLVSIAVVVAVWMAGMAGVALAADAAGPGDPLYDLDRAMERLQLRLTYNPEAATQLRMRLTEERMEEIQKLVRKQDQERLEQALGEYGDAVGALAAGPEARKQLADPARVTEMNQVLARNEEQMRYAFQEGVDEEDDTPGVKGTGRTGNGWYTNTTTITHPVALSLASQYEISATQVVSWFADGYGFGEIMHALKTSDWLSSTDQLTDTTFISSTQELLLWRSEEGWGRIWQELGLIGNGKPDHAGAPHKSVDTDAPEGTEDDDDGKGPPDHAGPKDDDEGAGPPDHAGPKDKEDKETGPPPHAGPKDDGNGDDGDPEDADDDGTGPPDHAGPKNQKSNNGNGSSNGNGGH